jgi:hypothetical protein
MRRTIVLLATAVVLALWAIPAFAQDDQNCVDFKSQAAAQAHLRSDPSDPDGLDAHPGPADGNDQAGGDGIACESNPGPFDREPVFAGPKPTEPPTTKPPATKPPATQPPAAPETPPLEAPANQAPPTTVPGALPFTGPTDSLLPAGTALLALGLLAVAVTRYRGRHSRR